MTLVALASPAKAVVVVDVDAFHPVPAEVSSSSATGVGFFLSGKFDALQTFVVGTTGAFTGIRLQLSSVSADFDLNVAIVTVDSSNQPDAVLGQTSVAVATATGISGVGGLVGGVLDVAFTPFAVTAGSSLGILLEPVPGGGSSGWFFTTRFGDRDGGDFRSNYADGLLLRANNDGAFQPSASSDYGFQTLVDDGTPSPSPVPLPPAAALLFAGLGALALKRRG
ncbi:MAG: hypothetical protein AAF577_08680 [Pseudomonadota bacterium]